MDTFTNTHVETLTWTRLQRPDGRTLTLAPGEKAELDLPPDFADEHLKRVPVVVSRSQPDPTKKPASAVPDEE